MSDLDAIILGSGNPIAIGELERIRRIERAARKLVDSWRRSPPRPDDIRSGAICAELEAAVLAAYRP